MVYRTLTLEGSNRQQFMRFVSQISKKIKNSKVVRYEGHDRASRSLFLSFNNEVEANKIINDVKNIIQQHGYESYERKANN